MQKTARFFFSLITLGFVAGLIGVCLTLLFHFVQQLAFTFNDNGSIAHSFREAVAQTSGWIRWGVLTLCGVFVGVGWFGLRRLNAFVISTKKVLKQPQKPLPFFTTLIHGLLQIITVGLGSPLGRESAPREISMAAASVWLRQVPLNYNDNKLLLACASGAGLAAMFNTPLAGTVLILETMILVLNPRAMFSAMCVVAIATAVSRFCLGDVVQYANLPRFYLNTALVVFAPLLGMVIGVLANLFYCSTRQLPLIPRNDKRIVILAVWAFCLIGLFSLVQPEILGGGEAGNQLTFGFMIDWQESLRLALLKWGVLLLALAAGAYGGLITPTMMLGSTFAYAVALWWNALFPQYPLCVEAAAIMGASAFLGVALKMPLTAILFLLELTRSGAEMLMPMSLTVVVAVLVNRACRKYER